MYLRGVIYKIQGRNNKSGDTVFELKPSPIGAVNYRENGHNITCKGLMVYYPVSTPVVMEGDYDTSNNIFKFHYIAVDFREYSTSIAFLKTFASIGIDTADSLYHKINYLRPYPFTSTYSSPNTPVQDISTDVKSLNDIVYINKTERKIKTIFKKELQ